MKYFTERMDGSDCNTKTNRVQNKFKLVRIAPFGPRPYSFITALYETVSRMSMFAGKGTIVVAGSRFRR